MATFGNTTKSALDETAHKVDPEGFAHVGDIWQMWDKRSRPDGGSRFEIIQFISADGDPVSCAFAKIRPDLDLYVQVRSLLSGSNRHIRLGRLVPNSSGYRLLERPGSSQDRPSNPMM